MRWRITLGRNHYWLNDEEKDYYLNAISHGQKYVVLTSGKVLSANFLDLIPETALDETEKIDSGKRQCKYKIWHTGDCYCDMTLTDKQKEEFKSTGIVPIIISTIPGK